MQKLLSIVLVMAMILSMFAGLKLFSFAESLPINEDCGDEANYTLDKQTDTLTISVEPAKPITIQENTHGYWSEDSHMDDYYYYTQSSYSIFLPGNKIIVHYSEGDDVEYTYDEDEGAFLNEEGERIIVSVTSDQYRKPWLPGSDNYFTVECLGATTQVPVTIIEHPVASIQVELAKPIEIIENTGGYWDWKWNDDIKEDYYYYYNSSYSIYKPGNQIIVTNTDDSQVIYSYSYDPDEEFGESGFFSEEGESIRVQVTSEQSQKPWVLGSDNYFTVEYKGFTTQVPVTIKENPVASIQVVLAKPIEIIENTGGYWSWKWNDDIKEDYYYYSSSSYSIYQPGNQIIVNNKDNSQVIYTYDKDAREFINEQGEAISIKTSENQYSKPWVLGNDNYFTLTYLDVTTQVPVSIIENPVASIQVVPAKPIEIVENSGGYWRSRWNDDDVEEEYYCYYSSAYSIFKPDNQIIVNYKDGTGDTYTHDEEEYFINAQGKTIRVKVSDKQYSKPWVVGNDNFFTVECLGVSTQVPVSIIENPVASIQVVPAKPIEIIENTGGYWDWRWNDDDVEEDYYYYSSSSYSVYQ
ncbi:MAG: hypothetical protein IKE65_01400, partial [Clostridia bacterium]|nr:hypothetical protein [Clostridia bacterium]